MLSKKKVEKYLRPLSPLPTSMAPRLVPLKDIRCVIFDIYGTLFISGSGDISVAKKMRTSTDQIAALLKRYGLTIDAKTLPSKLIAEIEKNHAILREKGIDHPEIRIERIWPTVLGVPDSSWIRSFAVEYEMIVNPVYPMPYLREVISNLKSRDYILGMISNAQFFTPSLFEWFLNENATSLGFDPDLVIYSYKMGRAKPSLILYESIAIALERRGLDRQQALLVGNDMYHDILGGYTAGFRTALFAGDARSLRLRQNHPCCRGLSPDLILADLTQLLPCI